MGKKIETAQPAATESPAPSAKTSPAPEPNASLDALAPKLAATSNGNGSSKKAEKKKKAAPKKSVSATVKVVATFSTEEIALRAYFISEHRHRNGLPGDEQSDWIEAERQLRLEQKKAAGKKPAVQKRRA